MQQSRARKTSYMIQVTQKNANSHSNSGYKNNKGSFTVFTQFSLNFTLGSQRNTLKITYYIFSLKEKVLEMWNSRGHVPL